MSDSDQAAQGIGDLPIDPSAVPSAPAPGGITPQQEQDFYKQSKAEYDLEHNKQNLGLLGKIFGSNSSAPTNIAGGTVLLCFLLYALSYCLTATPDLSNGRAGLLGLIGTALGYIFGAASKKD
ncbi:hypothetical protein [Burkholderia glumae]|uniref:hypothetical protein n=1 Tax=Burkholderia glumae TaxID=337 RepID=UPI0012FCE467|nr:hypothetical protein [Burkholderia glumae]